MKLQIRQVDKLALSANESLYTRAPAHAPDGAAYSDFMVLILGLRDLSRAEFSERVAGLQAVLGQYQQVVFADLNVPLNLLWVTLIPEFGLITTMTKSLRQRIPEARLIGYE
ncbi:hypothetical protein N9444_01160 [Gammaproteobacteria bacterium]|jgi:hypothetical protein|nr:hypothetical protein [Gammaproteobacteria bacterium]MDG2237771.1 hypothetical protein [Arenicellales bacterium]